MSQIPANSQNAQQPVQPVPQQKKKVRENFTLKAEHFQKQNGLQSLYKAIQKLDLHRGQDNVQASMKKIAVILKTWHFQMLPRYSFDYFLQRCKALGENKFTQAYMAKVRKIHKKQDSWGNEQNNQLEALKDVDLDHLNPGYENKMMEHNQEQSLDKKIERAMKIVNQISGRQDVHNFNQKMQIERPQQKNRYQINEQDQQDDDCEELFRQMDALTQEKKQLFSKSKKEDKASQNLKDKVGNNQELQIQNSKQESQEPYVPQGFDQIDYGPQSSDNNEH